MAFVFDLVVNLLHRFDIRSREFREMVKMYFGANTRQFQHEFYHFVLSGMSVEDYDRHACYTREAMDSQMARASATSTSTSGAVHLPDVVTLDSDDEDSNANAAARSTSNGK